MSFTDWCCALHKTARAVLERALMFGDDFVLDNYMLFIVSILRVRQASCHASLVPPDCRDRASEVLDKVKKWGKEQMDVTEAEELLERLRGAFGGMESEKIDECAVCFESIGEDSAVVLRACKHVSGPTRAKRTFTSCLYSDGLYSCVSLVGRCYRSSARPV